MLLLPLLQFVALCYDVLLPLDAIFWPCRQPVPDALM